MIAAIITMTVPNEKRKEILQTLRAILDPIRREQGCIRCTCSVDVEDECALLFEEEWNTRDDLVLHLRSEYFGVLDGAMRMLRVEPEIRFNTIVSTAGAEIIESAMA
jgi:quinol monooxygenase YgiN